MFIWTVTFRCNGRHEVVKPMAEDYQAAVAKATAIGQRDKKLPPDMAGVMVWGVGAVEEVHE